MKRLICEKDIAGAVSQGQSQIHLDADTIITAAATDAADAAGIALIYDGEMPASGSGGALPVAAPSGDAPLDPELIYRAVKKLEDRGLLDGIIDDGSCLGGCATCSCAH